MTSKKHAKNFKMSKTKAKLYYSGLHLGVKTIVKNPRKLFP